MTAERIRSGLRAEDAVTLAEMMVVMVILGIVLAGMTTLFVSASSSQVEQSNRVEAQQEARLALDSLRREIRCASAVTSVSTSSITITLPGYCQKPPTTGSAPYTWCVSGAAAPYALWRYAGNSCSGTGTRRANLLASNAVFTYNRPATLSPAPTLTAGTAGTLGPGTYVYSVTDVDAAGKETARARASITFATGATNSVTVTWPSNPAAVSYNVYGRDDGTTTVEGLRLLKQNATSPWVDTGGAFASMAAPPLGTLGVSLVVDASPGTAAQRFSLVDDIVLRNSGRG